MTIVFNQYIATEASHEANQYKDVIYIFLGFVLGLIGAYFGHYLTSRRDKAARRINFVAFLNQWRSEVSMFKQTERHERADSVVYYPSSRCFTPKSHRRRMPSDAGRNLPD